MDVSTLATVVTALVAAVISYLLQKPLQKPYVRVVKMFVNGKPDYTTYKLKNAGAATATCIVVQDRYGHAIDLDVRLSQLVKSVDALPQGSEITVGIPDSSEPVSVHYENLFGLLFHTELSDAGNRFRMTARKTLWPWHRIPADVRRELPTRWWRRG
jgi:hypothetical protein